MPRVLRLVMALLLSLAMPAYGFAGLATVDLPCPMKIGLESHVAAHEEAEVSAPECCNDLDASAETGKACKTGQDCPAGHAFYLPTLRTIAAKPADGNGLAAPSTHPLQGSPSVIWRPPASH